jgi:hypothetical protein
MKEIAQRCLMDEELNRCEQLAMHTITRLKNQYFEASKQYGRIEKTLVSPYPLNHLINKPNLS